MPYNEHMGLPVRHALTWVPELSAGIIKPCPQKTGAITPLPALLLQRNPGP